MRNLANNKYIKGTWIKDGDEYRLESSYDGPPPPIPPALPAPLAKILKEKTGIDVSPVPEQKDGSPLIWSAIGLGVAVCAASAWGKSP